MTTWRDYAWATLAAAMAVLLVGGVIQAIWWFAGDGAWLALLAVPVQSLIPWWFGIGA